MVSSWDDSDEKTQVFDNERAEGVPSGAERWYISPDGKTKEVLSAAEIIERARSGALSDATLVWRDGLTDWTRLDAVPELMQAMIAFRSSSSATVVREPGRDSAPSSAGVAHGALPLPPVPPAPKTGSGNRVSTSGPLPPPPSLPPVPGVQARASVASESQELNTIAVVSPLTKPREPQPTLSSVASQAGQLVANSSREALGRASVWANKALSIVDRDVKVPEIGVVNGRWLALIGVGLVGLLAVLLLIMSGDDPTQSSAVTSSGSSPASSEARGDGVDLDDDDVAADQANPDEPVAMGELEPVEPTQSKGSGSARANSGAAAKPAKKGKEFDVLAAKSALSVAAAKAATCKQGPKGEGSVRVKIAPSGKVVSVALTTPAFTGTAAGNCVLQVFRAATVPPFAGEDKTVFKKFVIN